MDIQSQERMSIIWMLAAASETGVLGLFVLLSCMQTIQLAYLDFMWAFTPGHHTELAAAAIIAFSAKLYLCRRLSICDQRLTGMTILTRLYITKVPEGKSKIEKSLKKGLYS